MPPSGLLARQVVSGTLARSVRPLKAWTRWLHGGKEPHEEEIPYADVPRPGRKWERKPYVTPMKVLIRRAKEERRVRQESPCRVLEHPPDNGLLVPHLIKVAHQVHSARERFLDGVARLVKGEAAIPVKRCRFCSEVHIGEVGHEIRTCEGPDSGSRNSMHVWRPGTVKDVVGFPYCYHLFDRVGKARVVHKEKYVVPRLPAILELCIQAGVDVERYPTKRRTRPVYSIDGRIADFELDEEDGSQAEAPPEPLPCASRASSAPAADGADGGDDDEEISVSELSSKTLQSWLDMRSGAARLMRKYGVVTCGYCPDVQVGPKGHKVRMCKASKHQQRDGQHAWQEATVDDLVPPNHVWHVRGGGRSLAQTMHERDHPSFPPQDSKHASREPGKTPGHVALSKSSDHDNVSQGSSVCNVDRVGSVHSGEDGSSGHARKPYSPAAFVSASPLVGLPEFSHLGWGHWFTLRDLEFATNRFSKENVLGEGGYGVVYRGRLVNGTEVAIKKIFNNMGQAEKEFRVEVEAIGHVRHKNLVRLLGYCVEGVNRMLVYEFVNNGNLEQWLHGAMRQHGVFTWENRMKVVIGTAKALAYLHEAIEPKVVHRDIKSSNILIDNEFNGKVSDFGLAKMLGSDKSHITTRVMGTFGYVAPEYANTGMLNEKSDVYSFGVLLLETVTGRDPVDYSRSANEVNLVEWLKMMIANRRAEEVVDPILEIRPTIRALKRALLIALRCVDPDSEKRPKMGQVARMLESEEVPYREDRRNRRSRTGSMDIESITEGSNSTEFANKVERTGSSTSDRSQS